MLQRTQPSVQSGDWQKALSDAINDPAELLSKLELDENLLSAAQASHKLFPLRVPRGYVAKMRKGDANDPLLLQVLPLLAEQQSPPNYQLDPVGDLASMKVPGLLHKYPGRVLLVITGACAIHCRYCFRRHFPYAHANPIRDHWAEALNYIRADATITEVILSGGDPLTLPDKRLAALLTDLATIPNLVRLRIHTRLPIVLPERITPTLLTLLASPRWQSVMVVHANHANEIGADVEDALKQLRNHGVQLLNQTVLLRGINDSTPALAALSERLFAASVLPYYLHTLDPVAGASHFDISDDTARKIHRSLQAHLPGYLVPRLVRERPGEFSKTLL